jgi:hypothetical protein
MALNDVDMPELIKLEKAAPEKIWVGTDKQVFSVAHFLPEQSRADPSAAPKTGNNKKRWSSAL